MNITRKDVEKLIELEKENTFFNHLWNIFSRDFKPKGEINQKEIKIWKQNIWNMTFYPIFTFEFDSDNHLTNITNKLNPVGKTFIGIFISGFLYLIFPENPTEFNLIENWRIIVVISVFVFLVIWVARKIYKFEKNNQLNQIFEILDIEIEEKTPEKEWSLKNILIRLFTYSFSIFIIAISLWSLYENGVKSIIMTLFGIGICGMYLYSDVKIIMKNKKTTDNKKNGKSGRNIFD